jgi:hypothetical protein
MFVYCQDTLIQISIIDIESNELTVPDQRLVQESNDSPIPGMINGPYELAYIFNGPYRPFGLVIVKIKHFGDPFYRIILNTVFSGFDNIIEKSSQDIDIVMHSPVGDFALPEALYPFLYVILGEVEGNVEFS